MKEFKVPVQSLINHIKTAIDLDPWAQKMAEDLLKRNVPRPAYCTYVYEITEQRKDLCPKCGMYARKYYMENPGEETKFCPWCGQAVKWDGCANT